MEKYFRMMGSCRSLGSKPGVLLILVFTITASAHGWLVAIWGSPLPFWDEWDGIGLALYRPYMNGQLHWDTFFTQYNEHTITLTRLQSLTLFAINGRWAVTTEMLWNCLWYGLIGVMTILPIISSPLPQRRFTRFGWLFAILVLIAPFGWQNALWAFQSQNYFSLLLGLVVFWLLSDVSASSRRIVIGIIACLVALLANGGGVLVALSICLLYILFGISRSRSWKEVGPILIASLVVAILGLCLRTPVPETNYLKAKTVMEFVGVFSRCLSWPNIYQPLIATVLYTPLAIVIVQLFQTKRIIPHTGWMMAAGILAIVHTAAIAYTRASGLPNSAPFSRYQEVLAIGAIANFYALLEIKPLTGSKIRQQAWALLCVCWTTFFVVGLIALTYENFTINLPFKKRMDASQIQLLTSFAQTHETATIATKSLLQIGHTRPDVIIATMIDPVLADKLPAVLQNPPASPTLIETITRYVLLFCPWIFLGSSILLFLVFKNQPSPQQDQSNGTSSD